MVQDERTEDSRTQHALVGKIAELAAQVDYLSARQQVVDVYRRYTRGLNRFDLGLLESAFWPDAQINYGASSRLRDEWISRWRETRYEKGLACQAHHITNETVDIVGDAAHVESYLIAFWRPPADSTPALVIGGRYVDRVDRRNGEWRIAVREFIPHFWTEGTSIFHSLFDPASWPRAQMGAADRSDPCYRRPLSPRQG